ncbi:MAG: hypothetical protein HRU40_10395 [Saprospiraceae bacterium]|nr:hypothetical protein [Saprospiraceae bacterium]
MKSTNQSVSIEGFLSFFPTIELPVTLTSDLHHTFSQRNEPFPPAILDQYLIPLEGEDIDELTEFIPCFKLPNTYNFHAFVYWKAGLMTYEYVLVSISEKGELIDKRVIAGTSSNGDSLTTSIATIEEDFEILILSGHTEQDVRANFIGAGSKATRLELLPEGQLVNIDNR